MKFRLTIFAALPALLLFAAPQSVAGPATESQLLFTKMYQGSAGNGSIAYQRNNEEIATIAPNGGEPIILVEGSDMGWSKDGSSFAYTVATSDYREIYLANADGSNQRRLTRLGETQNRYNRAPRLSPDKSKVAFTSVRNTGAQGTDIYVINSDGTELKRLTFSGQTDTSSTGPSWSPNGSKILFTRCKDATNCWIGAINPDGTGAESLAKSGPTTSQPSWSPNGRKIVFLRSKKGFRIEWDLHAVRSDGSRLRRVTNTRADESTPSWSPDGALILFGRDGEGIWTIKPTGRGARSVSTDNRDGGASWSPDGARIVFDRYKGETANIMVINRDGEGLQTLTTGNFDSMPVWLPAS